MTKLIGKSTTDKKKGAAYAGNLTAPSENNFTALRFIAASLVIVSHGYELPTGLASHDWAYITTGKAFSWYAVNMFFVMSGYLIFLSWERNPSAKAFFWARFLRLVPGMFVMLLVTTVILGIAFSELPFTSFFTNSMTVRYFFGCLSIIGVRYQLPEVFSTNPIHAVNGSLWTLRYEILCYLAIAITGVIGVFRLTSISKLICLVGLLTTITALLSFEALRWSDSNGKLGTLYELARLASCFQLGIVYAEFQDKIPLRFGILVGLTILSAATIGTPLFSSIASMCTAYATFWLAFVPKNKWILWTRSGPDYSYGIYIYAYPVQQGLISAIPGISTSATIIGGFLVTLLFAAFSWHFVEKPCLAQKWRFAKPQSQNHPHRHRCQAKSTAHGSG